MDRTETNCIQTSILNGFAPIEQSDKKSGSETVVFMTIIIKSSKMFLIY
jgi:hypothetical protein